MKLLRQMCYERYNKKKWMKLVGKYQQQQHPNEQKPRSNVECQSKLVELNNIEMI